ncbi:unannotated protein [freshwater metagenome]|uniref:Unannotated protein n=1 Tax=freshwater metagenome TaxID=449393 RepID=A0A6J6FHT8_9ZZZZ
MIGSLPDCSVGCSVGSALSDATGVGVTVVESDDEFLEITAIAKTKIPTTTAIITALDDPLLLLLADEDLGVEVEGLGVVEIEETDDLEDPLTGTAGIEYRVDDFADLFAVFLTLRFAEDFLTLFFTDRLTLFLALRLADAFFTAFFFAAT